MPMLKSMTRVIRVLLPAAAAVSVAGCSADVARFDSAGFTGSDNQQTSSIPIPPASVYSPAPRAGLLGEGDGASHQPPPMADGSRGGDVRVAELPPTSNGYGQPPRSYDRGYDAAPPARSYDRSAAGLRQRFGKAVRRGTTGPPACGTSRRDGGVQPRKWRYGRGEARRYALQPFASARREGRRHQVGEQSQGAQLEAGPAADDAVGKRCKPRRSHPQRCRDTAGCGSGAGINARGRTRVVGD